jgi:hypothetical protein
MAAWALTGAGVLLRDLGALLREILNNSFMYIIYLAIATSLLWTYNESPIKFSFRGQRIAVYAARATVIAPLLFLATLTFADRIFGFIPADKGGGDYSYSPDSQICMASTRTWRETLPLGLLCSMAPTVPAGCSTALKVLEATEQTMFVARSDDYGTDKEGRAPPDKITWHDTNGTRTQRPAAEVWREGVFLPKVYALSRGEVVSVEYGSDLVKTHLCR